MAFIGFYFLIDPRFRNGRITVNLLNDAVCFTLLNSIKKRHKNVLPSRFCHPIVSPCFIIFNQLSVKDEFLLLEFAYIVMMIRLNEKKTIRILLARPITNRVSVYSLPHMNLFYYETNPVRTKNLNVYMNQLFFSEFVPY
jgi:hypothetical protein